MVMFSSAYKVLVPVMFGITRITSARNGVREIVNVGLSDFVVVSELDVDADNDDERLRELDADALSEKLKDMLVLLLCDTVFESCSVTLNEAEAEPECELDAECENEKLDDRELESVVVKLTEALQDCEVEALVSSVLLALSEVVAVKDDDNELVAVYDALVD